MVSSTSGLQLWNQTEHIVCISDRRKKWTVKNTFLQLAINLVIEWMHKCMWSPHVEHPWRAPFHFVALIILNMPSMWVHPTLVDNYLLHFSPLNAQHTSLIYCYLFCGWTALCWQCQKHCKSACETVLTFTILNNLFGQGPPLPPWPWPWSKWFFTVILTRGRYRAVNLITGSQRLPWYQLYFFTYMYYVPL